VRTVSRLDLGAYEAKRAAALAGVPVSTLYDWARAGIVTPSVSAQREKLWSYADLFTIRLVRWLRDPKPDIARTTMREVREVLDRFAADLWREDNGAPRPTIAVTRDGMVVHPGQGVTAYGQQVMDVLDLFAPFETGVDLREPAEHLRIHPGRLAGEPHLVGTRLTTRTIAALAARGYDVPTICRLYPDEDPVAIREALDLEEKLAAAA
jgi:uncharacterized protein (DUF433 family)